MAAAWRSLRSATFLAVRAITRGPLGVLVMTILMMALVYVQLLFIPALIQGAVDHSENQLIDTATASVQITPGHGSATIDAASALVSEVAGVDGVDGVAAAMRVGSEVSAGSRSGSWSVLAVDPVAYAEVFTTASNLIEGRWLQPGETGSIVLGVGIAGADLHDVASYRASLRSVHAGDAVTVTFADGSTTDITVAGIFYNHLVVSDAVAFITDAAAADQLPASADRATAIYVKTERGDEERVATQLQPKRADATYETWLDLRDVIDEQVWSFNMIKDILGVVSLIVAAVTVIIVTYVDLVGKRRTIGIERAIGIKANAIVASYALKAIAYAVMGTAVGAAILLGIVDPIIDRYPFSFPIGPVTLSIDGPAASQRCAHPGGRVDTRRARAGVALDPNQDPRRDLELSRRAGDGAVSRAR